MTDRLANEDVGKLNVTMQYAQRRHVDKGVNNLQEQPPRFIFRDALIKSLQENSKYQTQLKNRSQQLKTYLLQRLTLNKLLKKTVEPQIGKGRGKHSTIWM